MITVVGSLNMDLVVNTERIPRPGETVMGRGFKQVPGGKGANQAAAAARLGASVTMIGCVGRDDMGSFLLDSLRRDGADTGHVFQRESVPTGVAAIIVEDSGNNSITVAPGANYALAKEDITGKKQVIQQAAILLTQLETKLETVEEALRLAKEAGKLTILNPAPAAALSENILKNADILTPNETELEVLSGLSARTEEGVVEAARSLIRQGAGQLVVTLGEKGCIHVTQENAKLYPAYPVKAVDTTAAGDSFNGALAVYLDEGRGLEEAIAFATKVGAMTVTREGAQTSLPHREEVERFDEWRKEGKFS